MSVAGSKVLLIPVTWKNWFTVFPVYAKETG